MNRALIRKQDLSLVEDLPLNEKQLKLLLKRTPKQYCHTRPGKGGGTWTYVTGGYVRKVLNLLFGWDWDFRIISGEVIEGEAIVLGELTCRVGGKSITKMQYGNKDVIYKKNTQKPLSIGNDMKAAATDALKKCAAEIGIAADIYNAQDFKEIEVFVPAEVDKEKERVINFINNATTLESLSEVPEEMLLENDISKVYLDKVVELKQL